MSEILTAHDRPSLAESVSQILDDMVAAGVTGITVRVHDEHGDWTAAAGSADPTAPPTPQRHDDV